MKNPITAKLIGRVYELARKQNSRFWWAIAKGLEAPRRQQPEVNLYKLERLTKEGETVLIPGRVLGAGELTHKLNVIALSFSKTALQKIKGTSMTITALLDTGKLPKGVRILK